MLQKLTVNNIAIIESIELGLGRGLSMLTGETGAGKSIIIDALGLALGTRADISMVRTGTQKAVVEAHFDLLNLTPEVKHTLENAELDYAGGDVVIRREVNANGKSRAFFNDDLIPLAALKIIGANLVEMHGQHENQKLFKPKNHLLYLGKCVADRQAIGDYREAYQYFKQQLRRYRELLQHRDTYLRERELREFHFKELDEIKPAFGELENMQHDLQLLENSSKLANAADQIARTLYEDDDAIIHQIETLKQNMQEILRVDEGQQETSKELQSALISLTEVGRTLAEYRDTMEHDPEKLAHLQERMGSINYQMRKHNMEFDQLCEYYEQLKDEMGSEADYDTRLEVLSKTLESARTKLAKKAKTFHNILEETGEIFSRDIKSRLHLLGMPNAKFKVDLRQKETEGPSYILFKGKQVEPGINGIDEVEFLIITNPGDDFKPLIKIASGGEISRIMLAIKSVLAEHDEMPTLIFDEIDSGVSGRIAHVVGEQIKELAKHHQILCITHLPQIASMGERHYRVDKYSKGNETFAKIMELSASERVKEIATIVGGENLSDASLRTAEELLNPS
ncbi:MAG: DNA repair protein RecN [Candidatus Marinimicrobia bacterium]|nr:DNA repair protein RecN [Candidatus Neomarinimicrobiota bacterium]